MTQPKRAWREDAAVVIAALAASYLFSEVIRSQLPPAIESRGGFAAWLLLASVGLSLLCVGVGVVVVSGIRVIRIRQQTDLHLWRATALDLLRSSAIVVTGFVLSVCALLTMGVLRG
jgi:hypothetical protein